MWGWAGVALSPNLDKKGDDIRVYSFATPDLRVSSLEVEAKAGVMDSTLRDNPAKLKDLLKEALVNSDAAEARPIVQLNGKPATYDLHSIKALTSDSGEVFLTTRVEGDGKTGTLAFEPKIEMAVYDSYQRRPKEPAMANGSKHQHLFHPPRGSLLHTAG